MSSECNCPLKGSNEVSYRGNLHADIMIVGEAPDRSDLRSGAIFTGQRGQLLMSELEKVGITQNEVFFANAVRCLFSKNTMKASEIRSTLAACRSTKLNRIIEHVKPKVIVCLGAVAMEQILRKKGIKNVRGTWHWSKEYNCHVIPTWHPAMCLREPRELAAFGIDLKKVADMRDNGYQISEDVGFRYIEVDTIRPLLDGGLMREDGTLYVPPQGVRVIRGQPIDENDVPFVTALDTETQGTQWYNPNSVLISYSIAANLNEGWQIYLQEEVPAGEGDYDIVINRGGTKKNPIQETVGIRRLPGYERKVAELKELCERPDIKKYFMNLKYEKHRFWNLGITDIQGAVMDIATAAHTLDSEMFLQPSLGKLVEHFLKDPSHKDVTKEEKEDMLLLMRTNREKFTRYACGDAAATLRVALALKHELTRDTKSLNYYVKFVHPAESELLFLLERNGVPIDTEMLPQVKQDMLNGIEEQTQNFYSLCPPSVIERHADKFKLTRRVILAEALFEYTNKNGEHCNYGFGIPPLRFSAKSGEPVADKEIRKELLDSPRVPNRAKDLILAFEEWSDLNTLYTRYIRNIEINLSPEGRLHPTYSFVFTSSGRTGARNPSIQNFPKRGKSAKYIRQLIKATNDDGALMEADYKVSELRWIAHVANERQLQRIFREGKDPHLMTGLKIRGLPEDFEFEDHGEMKKLRQSSKPVNFGLSYGMMAPGLRNYAYTGYGVHISEAESVRWRDEFFAFYRDLIPWHDATKAELHRNGFVRACFGRKRTIPAVNSTDNGQVLQAERIAVNFVIQNPSSDGTLLGGLQLIRDPEFDNNECKPIIFLHDALYFEFSHRDHIAKYVRLVRKHLEHLETEQFGFTLTVPLETEMEVSKRLSKTAEITLEEAENGTFQIPE